MKEYKNFFSLVDDDVYILSIVILSTRNSIESSIKLFIELFVESVFDRFITIVSFDFLDDVNSNISDESNEDIVLSNIKTMLNQIATNQIATANLKSISTTLTTLSTQRLSQILYSTTRFIERIRKKFKYQL